MISCDRTLNKTICTLQYGIPQIDDCDDSPSLAAEACLACSRPPTSHVHSPENESDALSPESEISMCQDTARVPTLLRTSPTVVFQCTNTHQPTHICECLHIRAHTHAFTWMHSVNNEHKHLNVRHKSEYYIAIPRWKWSRSYRYIEIRYTYHFTLCAHTHSRAHTYTHTDPAQTIDRVASSSSSMAAEVGQCQTECFRCGGPPEDFFLRRRSWRN